MSIRDFQFEALSTVQSPGSPPPGAVASATSIGDTITNFLMIVSGTTAIATVTPPVDAVHFLCLVFTNANPGGVTTGGNILNAVDPAQYVPVFLVFNPITQRYYAK